MTGDQSLQGSVGMRVNYFVRDLPSINQEHPDIHNT